MYFSNGFVYGGEPAEMLKVSSVKVLDNMMMLIRFNTGETRLFDASVLEGRIFIPLRRSFRNRKSITALLPG